MYYVLIDLFALICKMYIYELCDLKAIFTLLQSAQLTVARPLSSLSLEFSGATDSEDSDADHLQLALSKSITGDLTGSNALLDPDRGNTENSEGESITDIVKKKVLRKKRRPKGRSADFDDRTPTQDTFDYTVFAITNGNQ